MERLFQVSFVRSDGIVSKTTYRGWNAETAAYHEFAALKAHKKMLFACILDGLNADELELRVSWAKGVNP